MEPLNRTEIVNSFDEVLEYLSGIELEYNITLVDEIIDGYMKKINRVKKLHNYE